MQLYSIDCDAKKPFSKSREVHVNLFHIFEIKMDMDDSLSYFPFSVIFHVMFGHVLIHFISWKKMKPL